MECLPQAVTLYENLCKKKETSGEVLGNYTWWPFIGRRKNVNNRVFTQIIKLVIRWFIYNQGCFAVTWKCIDMRLMF